MDPHLQKLEVELLARNQELQEKAQKTFLDATAVISATEASQQRSNAQFIEESLKEVFERAEGLSTTHKNRDEIVKRKEEDIHSDEYEIPNNANATIRLQKAKIRELETQLAQIKDELKGTCAQLVVETVYESVLCAEEKAKEMKLAEEVGQEAKMDSMKEKEKSKKQQNELKKTRSEKEKAQNDVECAKTEIRELKTLLVEHEKEKRELASMVKSKDVRQKRIEEELEKNRVSTELLKQAEKDSKSHARKDYESISAANKKLEKQKSELIVALRKQFKLIDVLKRQKAHLEASKALSLAQDEFMKIISSS